MAKAGALAGLLHVHTTFKFLILKIPLLLEVKYQGKQMNKNLDMKYHFSLMYGSYFPKFLESKQN